MSNCTYSHSGWDCQEGQLSPAGVAQTAYRQPCPACATTEFLSLAWERAKRVNAACGCNTCLPQSGLGTAGLKIAIDEALRANPVQAQMWLQDHELGVT
jgi:hypothetical protein